MYNRILAMYKCIIIGFSPSEKKKVETLPDLAEGKKTMSSMNLQRCRIIIIIILIVIVVIIVIIITIISIVMINIIDAPPTWSNHLPAGQGFHSSAHHCLPEVSRPLSS